MTRAAADLARIRPRAGLDPPRLRTLAADGLLAMDDGELFLEYRHDEQLTFEDGRLKVAGRESGAAASAFAASPASGSAIACGDRLEEAAIRAAAATVQAVAWRPCRPRERGAGAAGRRALRRRLTRSTAPPAERKLDAARSDRRLLPGRGAGGASASPRRSPPRTRRSRSSAATASHRTDLRPLVRLNVSVVVERDGRRESAGHGGGGRFALDRLLEAGWWRGVADEALRQARLRLDAIPAPAGEMTVVLGAGWPGVMLHEAVGHGLEGDFNRKGTSAFAGLLGQRVAAPGVTVVDDGTMPERRGSLTIDDEGTPTGRNVLIEDGILVGYMQDRQNARLMRHDAHRQWPAPVLRPQHHAAHDQHLHAGGRRGPARRSSPASSAGCTRSSFGGGQVDITSGRFVFQATEAYLIEGGRVTAPVKGAMLIGNGPEALHRITAIGDDMALDNGIGTCGKNGQGVPVGVGQPTLRMERMTVGGTATA